MAHAYAEQGAYTATVTVTDAAGLTATSRFDINVADAALAGGGASLTAGTEGVSSSTLTAIFSDANASAPTGDFSGAINWGDGTAASPDITPFTSSAVSGGNGNYTIGANHQYAEEGTYTVTVSVSDAGGSALTIAGSAIVADAPLTASGTSIKAADGLVSAQAVVGEFVDLGGAEPVADYSAIIDWGDGATTSGAIVANGDGSFSVEGGHAYASLGNHAVTVSIAHENGISATAQSTALVQFTTGLLVLDPTRAGALNDLGNGEIQVSGGKIQVDSSSRAAIIADGHGTLSASQFLVSGSPGVFTFGGAKLNGPVTSGAASLSDPLSGLTAPSPDPAPHPAVFAGGVQQITLDPGTYAGGIHVGDQAVVTLNPGTYYLEGGGLSVSGRAKLIGDGVTIYNTGSNAEDTEECDPITVTGGGSLQLAAPESGSLQSIAIFQDRTSPTPMIVSGDASVQVSGLIYAADATLIVMGNAQFAVNGDIAHGLEAACIFDDVSVSGRALLSIDAAQNGQTSGNDSPGAGNMPGNSAPADDDLRALESFFQSLVDSSRGDEPSVWALGLGDDGELDGSRARG